MKRDFASREELAEYLAAAFPDLPGPVSPIRGGRAEAERKLADTDPSAYGFSRNYLDGKVTGLSPYIRHGVLLLAEARDHAFAVAAHPFHVSKFIAELAWRDYWLRLYWEWGVGVWEDRETYKTGLAAEDYADDLPDDVREGRTGLACMDAFARDLIEIGYVHNHARMWHAAYIVHWRRVKWQAGARWYLEHLLDGDAASNNLSWQWVASTFSHRPYLFDRANLEKYTKGRFCSGCPARERCPFERRPYD